MQYHGASLQVLVWESQTFRFPGIWLAVASVTWFSGSGFRFSAPCTRHAGAHIMVKNLLFSSYFPRSFALWRCYDGHLWKPKDQHWQMDKLFDGETISGLVQTWRWKIHSHGEGLTHWNVSLDMEDATNAEVGQLLWKDSHIQEFFLKFCGSEWVIFVCNVSGSM